MSQTAATSRAGLIRPAVRPAMPARLMISAPSGAGKTWTALGIARTLVGDTGRIVLIDTETDSALTYADEHVFEHLAWEPPYDPRELAATIHDLSTGTDVCIVIDSMSHFWQGDGGTLDIADGRFGGWKVATPAQDEMVMAILRSRSHMICCAREKQAYAVTESVKDGRTKQTVEKLGMAPIQREGLDYEFNVAVSMDMSHTISVNKTRCRRLAGRIFKPNHQDELADIYADWLAGGHAMPEKDVLDDFRARVVALPKMDGCDVRTPFLALFKDRFGTTEQLLLEDMDEATVLLVEHEAMVPGDIAAEFSDDDPNDPLTLVPAS